MGILDEIVAHKKEEIKRIRVKGERERPVFKIGDSFDRGVNIIAEIKRFSPSAGLIKESIDTDAVLDVYSRFAKAISVLTDGKFFGGSFEFLKDVAKRVNLPVLCKDFIIDKKQIDMAFVSGADIVLLIVRLLEKDELFSLYEYADRVGLECLVEVHSEDELAILKELKPSVVGVNSRDLDRLTIDLKRAKRILEQIDLECIKIAESGIHSREDVEFLQESCDGFLIGEALLKSEDIEKKFRELMGEG